MDGAQEHFLKRALRGLFSGRPAKIIWPTATLILALVLLGSILGVHLRSPFGSDAPATGQSVNRRPAEFLYLDSHRALAYLAQLEGGTTESEQVSHKLTETLGGKLALKGILEANGETQSEDFAQRDVTPTAASSFVELVEALEVAGKLRHPTLRCFQCGCAPTEGEFVIFTTSAARAPIYLNPYLAVRQSVTLSALFPTGGTDNEQRKAILTEREAARKFATQVGTDPRIVFDLRPGDERGAPTQYLLPVSYRQLTSERSLIKYGGGAFTVLGKVVRVFPERGQKTEEEEREEPYVDSATRETWRRPLENAIPRLICSSDPVCVKRTRGADLEEREAAIDTTRTEMEDALREQTEVESRGAVILPIAIYK
jgi:hypothetical protein